MEDSKTLDTLEEGKLAVRREAKKANTQRIRVMIFLSVCYSANTGGSGTLTGQSNPIFGRSVQPNFCPVSPTKLLSGL